MKPEIVIEGIEETVASLEAVADNIPKPSGGWGAVESIVLLKARGNAPRRTGALAASGRGSGNTSRAAVEFGGASVPYANPIHWGWPARHIRAQPFLSEAIRQTEAIWERVYTDSMQRMVDRETR